MPMMSARSIEVADNQPGWNSATGPTSQDIVEPEAGWQPVDALE